MSRLGLRDILCHRMMVQEGNADGVPDIELDQLAVKRCYLALRPGLTGQLNGLLNLGLTDISLRERIEACRERVALRACRKVGIENEEQQCQRILGRARRLECLQVRVRVRSAQDVLEQVTESLPRHGLARIAIVIAGKQQTLVPSGA